MRRDASSPEAYRRDVEGAQRELLDAIRDVILEVAPDVEEAIRYGMLDYPGLANLAAQKQYVALYVPPPVLAARKRDFAGIDSGKSCLRYRRPDQLDRDAVRRLLRDVAQYRRSHPTND